MFSTKTKYSMKKVMMFAVAALLVSGAAFAGGKKCAKSKECHGKDGAKKECCSKKAEDKGTAKK
jgi:hypothetical protein